MSPHALEASTKGDDTQIPSAATFSFKAPFPTTTSIHAATPLKQRRVSLALPSSTRVAWNFRDDTGIDSHVPETGTSATGLMPEKRGKMRRIASGVDNELYPEKKLRKKWSDEETQMLVAGCNIHGVGNWKTILSDPNLKFDNRSPVDLKDRFRTYFPDAYKEHYPNARTHLSSKVRSTLPDGSSLFEKTRSKKRRPFTEEEDRALKAGYEKHGTVWAAIVKDPVFKEQGRRSTDLRDRFRNAFPELYQAAGYKPRNAAKKKLLADNVKLPVRAATDDQLSMSTTGPVRSRRRSHTSQGFLRGGTKSVPQSTACSEDEDSSGGEEDSSIFKTPHTPVFVDNVSTSSRSRKSGVFDDEEMDMITLDPSDPLSSLDFLPSSSHSNAFQRFPTDMDSQSQTWSSGVNTPTHSANTWSTAAGSPTSSHLSTDYLSGASPSFHRRHGVDILGSMGNIGGSAWGAHDWFSANPRLDPGSSSGTSTSSYPSNNGGGGGADDLLSPASPFSFQNLHHGVLDRYDLHPSLFAHDFSSEVGAGDTHSTFSDEMFPPASGFRGFTHHSNYAGDLIFGARTSAHQHPNSFLQGSYLSGFGGVGGFGTQDSEGGIVGLGLSVPGPGAGTGIHPMSLTLPGIDEIELTGITLDDGDPTDSQNQKGESGMVNVDDSGILIVDDVQPQQQPGESVMMLSPPPLPLPLQGEHDQEEPRFSLDDLVDLSVHEHELQIHATPPATPVLLHPSRSARRSSSTVPFHSYHGRSISVPPTSEARSLITTATAVPSSSTTPAPVHSNLELDISAVRPGRTRQTQTQEAMALDLAITSTTPAASGTDKHPSFLSHFQLPPKGEQPASIFSPQALLSSISPDLSEYVCRPTTVMMTPGDMNNLNLSFLDLHYYGHGHVPLGGGATNVATVGGGDGGMIGGSENSKDEDVMSMPNLLRQGLALDLAQSAASNLAELGFPASSSSTPSSLKSLGIPASLRQHIPPIAFGLQRHNGLGSGVGIATSPGIESTPSAAAAAATAAGIMRGVPRCPAINQHHQRRQSAVCPQDLVLKSGDNKRKRASWDGAHS